MSSTTRRVTIVAIASMFALTSFAAEAATKSKSPQQARNRAAAAHSLQHSRSYGYVYGSPTQSYNMYGGGGAAYSSTAGDNTAGWGNIGMQ